MSYSPTTFPAGRTFAATGLPMRLSGFSAHAWIINGYSELMAQVFGDDAGVGARSAVGMGALPGDIPVEIEAIFEVK